MHGPKEGARGGTTGSPALERHVDTQSGYNEGQGSTPRVSKKQGATLRKLP